MIKTFSPGQTPNCWLIGFESKVAKERILQSNPMISNRTKIVDANEKHLPSSVTCNGKFRIHKLMPHIKLATVEDYLRIVSKSSHSNIKMF